MITKWTQHLQTSDKTNFENQIRNSVDVLDRLIEICNEELAVLELEEKDFSSGWQYRIAAIIGRREQLKRFIKLLDIRRLHE